MSGHDLYCAILSKNLDIIEYLHNKGIILSVNFDIDQSLMDSEIIHQTLAIEFYLDLLKFIYNLGIPLIYNHILTNVARGYNLETIKFLCSKGVPFDIITYRIQHDYQKYKTEPNYIQVCKYLISQGIVNLSDYHGKSKIVDFLKRSNRIIEFFLNIQLK